MEYPFPNIGISGKIGSAKTFCAKLFVRNYDYAELSFAWPLKEMLEYAREEDWYGLAEFMDRGPDIGANGISAKTDALRNIARYTYNHKEELEGKGRSFLQFIGTNYFRSQWPTYWIDWFDKRLNSLRKISPIPVVVDDVRFPNEAEYLRRKGFILLRCVLPDEERINRSSNELQESFEHSSETALDGYEGLFDATVSTSVAKENQFAELMGAIDGVLGITKSGGPTGPPPLLSPSWNTKTPTRRRN